MEKTLKVLNELEKSGLLMRYAIGGAIAVLFHAEPVLTYDMDVFCFLPETKATFVTLAPIYACLKKKGYRQDKEHTLIEGIPVQFIPAYNALVARLLARLWRPNSSAPRHALSVQSTSWQSSCKLIVPRIERASRTFWLPPRLTRAL